MWRRKLFCASSTPPLQGMTSTRGVLIARPEEGRDACPAYRRKKREAGCIAARFAGLQLQVHLPLPAPGQRQDDAAVLGFEVEIGEQPWEPEVGLPFREPKCILPLFEI